MKSAGWPTGMKYWTERKISSFLQGAPLWHPHEGSGYVEPICALSALWEDEVMLRGAPSLSGHVYAHTFLLEIPHNFQL